MKTKQLDWTKQDKERKYKPMLSIPERANWARCCYTKQHILMISDTWNKIYGKAYISLYK